MTDIYIEILRIVEGDVAKATAIKKIIDEAVIEKFLDMLIKSKK
jgi:hypothetical protein